MPESFRNLEIMARTLFAVPKTEVDALEKQEKKDKKTNRPSDHLEGLLLSACCTRVRILKEKVQKQGGGVGTRADKNASEKHPLTYPGCTDGR